MVRTRLGAIGLLALALIVCPRTAVHADVHVKQTMSFEMVGMPNMVPPGMDTLEIWVSEHNARLSMGPMFALLVDADERTFYILDHTSQTYSKVDLNANLDDMASQTIPGLQFELDSLIKTGVMFYECFVDKMNLTVTPTGESKDVSGHATNGYTCSMSLPVFKETCEMWVDESTNAYMDTWIALIENMFPGVGDLKKVIKAYYPIEGLIVEQVADIQTFGMAMKSTATVVEYSEGPAPANAYAIPSGYTEKVDSASGENEMDDETYYEDETGDGN